MDLVKFENALKIGETAAIEFKRAGGTVVGIPENAAPSMVKNFISAIGNPDLFSPTLYLEPEIFKYRKKTLIHIHVPSSGEVH